MAASRTVVYTLKVVRDALTVTSVSEDLPGTLGYGVEEALTPNWWLDALHPEDRADVLASLPSLLGNGRWAVEYRFRHKDSSYRWLRDEAHLRWDAAGRPIEVIGKWTDVSEQRSR